MKQQLNELKRMQQLAGVINEVSRHSSGLEINDIIKKHINTYQISNDPLEIAQELGKKYKWSQEQILKAEKILRTKYLKEENSVDSIPEIQAYLKNLALSIPKTKGIDTNEVKSIVELINLIIAKIGKGSIAPTIKAATDIVSKRTQSLK